MCCYVAFTSYRVLRNGMLVIVYKNNIEIFCHMLPCNVLGNFSKILYITYLVSSATVCVRRHVNNYNAAANHICTILKVQQL
jgi:hypothetical protein